MTEVRRGPEYVPGRRVEARRTRVKRGLVLALVPLGGLGLALLFTNVLLPQRRIEEQSDRLKHALLRLEDYHSIEYRVTGDSETILREEWKSGQRRRVEYFGGQIVFYHFSADGRSRDLIYEQSTRVVRRHRGASMGDSAPARLLTDMNEPDVQMESGPDGVLVLYSDVRRHLIRMDARSGKPTGWTTLFPSDLGEQMLTRTEIDYDGIDRSKLEVEPEVLALVRDSPGRPPGRNRRPAEPIAAIGKVDDEFDLDWIDINQHGDLFYGFRSRTERPFIQVVDGRGNLYSPLDIISGDRTTGRIAGEQLSLRLDDTQLSWPVTVTLSVKDSDPRFLTGPTRNRKIGSSTFTFERPTCVLAPPQWFSSNVSDRPLYDYLRTRHYRLALVFQNMLRTPEGRRVDALGGGAASLEQSVGLKKDPDDLRRALAEARTFLRVRNEFDSGRMSVGRVYVMIAELHQALGEHDAAKRAIQFAQGMVREGRVDLNTVGDIERTAKELGL